MLAIKCKSCPESEEAGELLKGYGVGVDPRMKAVTLLNPLMVMGAWHPPEDTSLSCRVSQSGAESQCRVYFQIDSCRHLAPFKMPSVASG